VHYSAGYIASWTQIPTGVAGKKGADFIFLPFLDFSLN